MQTDAYARALMRLIEEGERPSEAVKKLHALLEREGRAALLPSIGRAFQRLAAKKAARDRAILTVAHAKDEAKARKESGAKDAEVVVDESLIGGWRLEAEGMLQDASWKNHLVNIYQNVTRA